jgi:hypothetical protein
MHHPLQPTPQPKGVLAANDRPTASVIACTATVHPNTSRATHPTPSRAQESTAAVRATPLNWCPPAKSATQPCWCGRFEEAPKKEDPEATGINGETNALHALYWPIQRSVAVSRYSLSGKVCIVLAPRYDTNTL